MLLFHIIFQNPILEIEYFLEEYSLLASGRFYFISDHLYELKTRLVITCLCYRFLILNLCCHKIEIEIEPL